jgi:hypothetical protein
MTRLFLMVAAAALALGVAGCPLMHDDYPPASNTCQSDTDCFCGETCNANGACEPSDAGCAAETDAGIPDGGRRG